jgi:5-(carboxyamino)imidazole ribonucleotide synthase
MMALAGIPMGFSFLFLDPASDACAAELGELLIAEFDDMKAVANLSRQVDMATFDFENVPEAAAAVVADAVVFEPGTNALGLCQDRLSEKSLLKDAGIPVAAHHSVDSRTDLLEGVDLLGLPTVLKTRRMGYDGKGQYVLRVPEDLERAWQRLGGQALILEEFVAFEAECSQITVRTRDGEIRHWPVTQNVHENGILLASRPGAAGSALQGQAQRYLHQLVSHLDYVGVITVEFFIRNGELLANEIAPRVHNSGHWTIDGAETSQFENHLRAVAGLPLGDTGMSRHSLMLNWIGEMPGRDEMLGIPGMHWHDYRKKPRQGRKIGHATMTAGSAAELKERAAMLKPLLDGSRQKALSSVFQN